MSYFKRDSSQGEKTPPVITRDMKQQEAETEPISELKPTAMQEKEPKATTGTSKEETKREITMPQYLKDFVAK